MNKKCEGKRKYNEIACEKAFKTLYHVDINPKYPKNGCKKL